ncbi:hypothetical protein AB0J21_17640 [Streptomyces sp. NPDC049954]|uniref:hypothetical protein n=1 Tax=Streptomyces sp. NPDC049954 TaxID=3155779 RepID=UPI0034290142
MHLPHALSFGFRFEASLASPRSSSRHPRSQPRDLRVLPSPQEALRLVRHQVRDNKLFALNERELGRATAP